MTLSPIGNRYFGFVAIAGGAGRFGSPDNGSPLLLETDGKGNEGTNNGTRFVTDAFAGIAGNTLTLHPEYVADDGRDYDDHALVRLIDAATNQTAARLVRSG